MEKYSIWVRDEIAKLSLLASDTERKIDRDIFTREEGIRLLLEAIDTLTVDVRQVQTQQK